MAHRYESQSQSPTATAADDVLAALSAFPAPPSHIPPSPDMSNGSNHVRLPKGRERESPPSSFAKTARGSGVTRSDSTVSVGSSYSGRSVQSGMLSVQVNGRVVEGKRDSGSGSSMSSGSFMNGADSRFTPSPMSGRGYYTAPNSPLLPGTPAAGPSSGSGIGAGTPSSSASSLNTPASAHPRSTSPASAYPSSSASNSAYPHSPAYSYANASRQPYTPLSSTSVRGPLSMLPTPASATTSTSSSPSSVHVPISAVGMSPIDERDERPRPSRRQSSVPPSSRRRDRYSRGKVESESGSEIGGPPSIPLPPLPPTANTDSSFGEATPTPTPGPTSTSMTSRGPPSVKSLPSLRSGRKSSSSHGNEHGRRESGVSVMSSNSGVSAISAVTEFGVAMKNRVQAEVAMESTDDRPKSRARTPRAPTMPLRIDIPPVLAQDQDRVQRQLQTKPIEKPFGSGNSIISPRPRENGENGEKVNSPTASIFSVASGATARSALTTAQCLRTRVSGLLDALDSIPGTSSVVASSSGPTSLRTSPSPSGGGGEEERAQTASTSLLPSTASTMSGRSRSSVVDDRNGLLTAEDLHSEPLLARAVSPVASEEYGHGSLQSSSRNGTKLKGRVPHLVVKVPSLQHVPPTSDAETDGSDKGSIELDVSESLLGQFPLTPTFERPPPSSFPFPASHSRISLTQTPTSASSSNGGSMSRTMSQSRRKPLPPAPRHLRTSISSVNTFGFAGTRDSAAIADDAVDAIRGRKMVGRGSGRDGAESPDIATMMCTTPRPVLRSKSVSARSSRSSRSLSTRSSSVKSSRRERVRPSLPDESERQMALARFSAVSSSSASPSRMSSMKRSVLSVSRSEFSESYGGIEEDADASVDYGVAIARHRGAYDLSPSLPPVGEGVNSGVEKLGTLLHGQDAEDFYADEAEAMLDATGNGSPNEAEDESDSDIDLHTPLPHILLREGVLSVHSKVLASMSSNGSLSMRSSFVGSGRDSVASYTTNASFGSMMTKSGLFKDERNTETRRRRHRDGKLLKEGLGLTTGLGWSDSEDEDAPSPFTNQVSTLSLSRNASMASVRSASSKKSQFFSRSTPSSGPTSRTASTYSGHLIPPSSRSSQSPMRQSEQQTLSKSYSSTNLSRRDTGAIGKRTSTKTTGEDAQAMPSTPTSSSTTSLPFPPTPRDDMLEDLAESLPSDFLNRSRTASRGSSSRARTPTASSVKPKQSIPQLRSRSVSTKSAPASRLPSAGPSTPRPLRLPALQQQRMSHLEVKEDDVKLLPGQPLPNSGALLGYNRKLHDLQRAQRLAVSETAPSHGNPPESISPVLSPALSAKSAPSSSIAYGSRRAYGSMPVTSNLHPPSGNAASRLREPSPSRLSAPTSGFGKPRTGTGMVYRQSSMPSTPVATMVGRATAI